MAPIPDRGGRRVIAHPDNWERAEEAARKHGLEIKYDENCARDELFLVTPEEELPESL